MIKAKTSMFVAAALLLVGGAAGWWVTAIAFNTQLAEMRATHADYITRQQAASTKVISETLLRERQLQLDLSEARTNAATREETLTGELADSNAAARWMRDQLHDLSGLVNSDSATVAECKTARAAAGVLAELLEDADRLAGVFAEAAQRNQVAGLACEAEHDAVVKQNKRG